MNNRRSFDPGPLSDVVAQAAGDRWTLVFVRDLRHQPETVWAALTEPDQLNEWAPFTTDRNLSTPGDTTLTMIDGDIRERLPATVTRAEPPRLLEYTWGEDLLLWELAATDAGTRLTLRHTLSDREMVPQIAAGWHICLVVAEELLDGRRDGAIRGQDALNYGWAELRDAYARKLGWDSSG